MKLCHRRRFVVFFITFFFLPSIAGASRPKISRKQLTAKTAILWDSTRNKRLYAKNINRHILPASTTKVMTALLVLQRLPLDSYVTVQPQATGLQPSY